MKKENEDVKNNCKSIRAKISHLNQDFNQNFSNMMESISELILFKDQFQNKKVSVRHTYCFIIMIY